MQLDLFDSSPNSGTPAESASTLSDSCVPDDVHAQAALRASLERQSGMQVELVVTDNTSTMMSVKHLRRGSVVRLRVHRMFVKAPAPVVSALAQWLTLRRDHAAAQLLNEYIRDQKHQIRARSARPQRLIVEGEHFNLRVLYDEVNASYFGNRVTAPITWGRFPPLVRRRSITFGSYSQQEHLIRISPLLDQAFVPKYFVRFVVFHEMLHADLGIDESPNGRRVAHTREFRRIEQAHPDYARVISWQEKHLSRFLRGRWTWRQIASSRYR